jgi:hypothetical protein
MVYFQWSEDFKMTDENTPYENKGEQFAAPS